MDCWEMGSDNENPFNWINLLHCTRFVGEYFIKTNNFFYSIKELN